jgi:hypothetical protein
MQGILASKESRRRRLLVQMAAAEGLSIAKTQSHIQLQFLHDSDGRELVDMPSEINKIRSH